MMNNQPREADDQARVSRLLLENHAKQEEERISRAEIARRTGVGLRYVRNVAKSLNLK